MSWGITKFQGDEVISCENVNTRVNEINNLFPVPINKGGTGVTTAAQVRQLFNSETKVTLYHNISGTTGTVTLSQDASSCDRWGIYYGINDIGGYKEIDTSSDNALNLYLSYMSAANNLYTRSVLETINKSSRTITPSRNKTFIMYYNGARAVADGAISIFHVVGYK